MKRITFLLLILTTFSVQASDCKKWEYSSLSLTSKSILNGDELEKVNTFVLWSANDEYGLWEDNKLLSGSIKVNLTEYFNIKAVHSISMLNSLGMKGWEAYGYEGFRKSETDQNQSWQFKKCKV